MDADLDLLSLLVGDIEHFAEHHWGVAPLLRASDQSHRDILTIDDIEELLLTSSRSPAFRLVREGVTLPLDRSTKSVRLGGKDLDDVADLARIAAAVDDGATLVMQALQRTSPTMARFCRSLERAISHPVQANAYLSPPGAAGLRSHTDDHDVLALQLVGHKQWDVQGLGPVTTSVGDVLYIPAGTRHEAASQEEPSLHLTLGIIRVTAVQVVRRALADVDSLRAPLPLGYARPERASELQKQVHEMFRVASKALVEADPMALSGTERSRAARRRAPWPAGQLTSVLSLHFLDQTSRIERRTDLPATLEAEPSEEGRIALELPDRRIVMPAAMGPAVDCMLRSSVVTIGSLPGLDDESRRVLVRRLVREGVVRIASAD